MKKFLKPEIKFSVKSVNETKGRFVLEPLERGFGHTLGNALRRTILSSSMGAAVFAIRIDKVFHEFTAIKGINEHVAKIVLNIKELVLKIDNSIIPDGESVTLKISSDKEGEILAKDIICPAGVEILSKELHILTISKGGKINMELFARNSRGYSSFEDNKKEKTTADMIVIDSNYSPVKQISYNSELTKVGNSADLEKLELEIETNGSISAADALASAAKVLTDHLSLFFGLNEIISKEEMISEEIKKEDKQLNRLITDFDFTQRSLNCLRKAKIHTLTDLTSKTEDEVQNIKNLGKKSFQEIQDKLIQFKLSFKSE
ncbi:DNA-directed RNA polymerase subunit alpha [Spiroplasma endosymbiont of Amphibalanus improvisus]|uniref:DNA-directed RNA polymerase subunit alpha n=1 Tax=Spiroplasma endosymbiont of Amphibalanus improvisus TaxID=3066327 RepID=UPI00313B9BE6